jgi:hypothetical protein
MHANANVSSSSSSSSSSSTKAVASIAPLPLRHRRGDSVAIAVCESNPNVIHMTASEFRDDDWSEIERRRSRANMFRAKSPSAVRRVLDRPSALPKREPRPSTVPVPFSFDSETASFEQLAEFRAPMPLFKSSEYHAEHAHELELVRKQGKNRFVAPKPLTVPESPALKTRERVELYNERHHDELRATATTIATSRRLTCRARSASTASARATCRRAPPSSRSSPFPSRPAC